MFDREAKDLGAVAGHEIATAAESAAGKVGDAAQAIGMDLADAVSIVAGSINRVAEMGGTESAAWREEIAAWRGLLERGFVGNIGGMPFEIKPKLQSQP